MRLDRETIAYVDPTNAYFEDFGPFDGRVWLNTAHQGPLPKVAREAGKVALEQKVRPHLLRDEDFFEVPPTGGIVCSFQERLFGAVIESV